MICHNYDKEVVVVVEVVGILMMLAHDDGDLT